MAKGPTYNLPFRRRREGNTNYTKRKALLKSGIPRLIIRITGKHTIAQLTESTPTGDRVITSANSKELKNKYGWKGGSNNIPASYLTGLLAGKRANSKRMNKAIADIGLRRITKGSRIFCTLKGAIDSGLDITQRGNPASRGKDQRKTHCRIRQDNIIKSRTLQN